MTTAAAHQTKKELITNAIGSVRNFRFCGPSDDPDKQTAVTLGFRHLVIQLKRLAAPLLPKAAASRLNAIDVEVNDLYSAFDAKAELDALLPDIESALEPLNETVESQTNSVTPKPLPIPVCSIVGDVLGSFIYSHRLLDSLFYQAGAGGDVPPGSCVLKCQTWLTRLHTGRFPIRQPSLGKVLEEFMEVDRSLQAEQARSNSLSTPARWRSFSTWVSDFVGSAAAAPRMRPPV